MVERLSVGPTSVSELARPLEMSLAAVVQHIQVLEASGLVSSAKVGRVRTCRLEPAALASVEGWVIERKREWAARLTDSATTYKRTLMRRQLDEHPNRHPRHIHA